MAKQINVALIGNPNTGKTSVFNNLTGLNQKVGNYPGITVEKKQGTCRLHRNLKAHIIDLPGTYSLNASSLDENVVIELLLNKNHIKLTVNRSSDKAIAKHEIKQKTKQRKENQGAKRPSPCARDRGEIVGMFGAAISHAGRSIFLINFLIFNNK